jgi:hypothetical protein
MNHCPWCTTGAGDCTCLSPCDSELCTAGGGTLCPGPTRNGHRIPVPGMPVWCRPCQARITAAVAGLPAACRLLAPGRLANPAGDTDATRHSTVTGSPSPSPAWDEVDVVLRWAVAAEDRLRHHLRHSIRVNVKRTLWDAVAYLAAQATPWLCTPWAAEDGRTALILSRRIETASGRDRVVHRLPAPCPAPGCNRLALVRDDGSNYVACRACGSRWPEADYRRLTLILTSEARGS